MGQTDILAMGNYEVNLQPLELTAQSNIDEDWTLPHWT